MTETVAPPVKPPVKSAHRPEIQGLRAILMLQVLLFHAWGVGSPIGVDAFILISAYLMTSSFVRRSEAGHMPFFVERWANTFKRLLPPLVVVVLTTLGATFLLLPQTRWREMIIQSFASITYWENIRLSQVAADYFASDHALSSPLQHLWSMSMQGQVFLLWPLIMTASVLAARAMKAPLRKVVFAAFSVLTVASLLWLIWQGAGDGAIYFDTHARIWEFAFGSSIAAAAPWMKLPERLASAAASLGLAVIVLFSLVSIGSYPGPMAFFPMAATSAILLYAPAQESQVVKNALSLRPLTALGDVSYAVYLVHWPIFVFFLVSVDAERLSIGEGLVLIAVSIALAALLTRFVDDPLRNLPWANRSTKNKLAMVAISLTVGLVPVFFTSEAVNAFEKREEAKTKQSLGDDSTGTDGVYGPIPASGPGSNAHPGARAFLGEVDPDFTQSPIPGPSVVDKQWATLEGDCSGWVTRRIPKEQNQFCTAAGDAKTASARALIVGNSHAQQLLVPMVEPLIGEYNWRVEAILKGACSFGAPDAFEDECVSHNQAVLDYIDVFEPDYVFLMVTRTTTDSPDEHLVPGVEELVEDLTGRGITVIGLTDNLRSDEDLYECSDFRPTHGLFGGCLLDESKYFSKTDPATVLSDIGGYRTVDLRDAYCLNDVCPTIVGNVFVYMDKNHVTKSYAQTMAPCFKEQIVDLLEKSS